MTGKVSAAQLRATAKYEKKSYDHIHVRLPLGKRADIEKHITTTSESLNGFIKRAIDETIDRDRKK